MSAAARGLAVLQDARQRRLQAALHLHKYEEDETRTEQRQQLAAVDAAKGHTGAEGSQAELSAALSLPSSFLHRHLSELQRLHPTAVDLALARSSNRCHPGSRGGPPWHRPLPWERRAGDPPMHIISDEDDESVCNDQQELTSTAYKDEGPDWPPSTLPPAEGDLSSHLQLLADTADCLSAVRLRLRQRVPTYMQEKYIAGAKGEVPYEACSNDFASDLVSGNQQHLRAMHDALLAIESRSTATVPSGDAIQALQWLELGLEARRRVRAEADIASSRLRLGNLLSPETKHGRVFYAQLRCCGPTVRCGWGLRTALANLGAGPALFGGSRWRDVEQALQLAEGGEVDADKVLRRLVASLILFKFTDRPAGELDPWALAAVAPLFACARALFLNRPDLPCESYYALSPRQLYSILHHVPPAALPTVSITPRSAHGDLPAPTAPALAPARLSAAHLRMVTESCVHAPSHAVCLAELCESRSAGRARAGVEPLDDLRVCVVATHPEAVRLTVQKDELAGSGGEGEAGGLDAADSPGGERGSSQQHRAEGQEQELSTVEGTGASGNAGAGAMPWHGTRAQQSGHEVLAAQAGGAGPVSRGGLEETGNVLRLIHLSLFTLSQRGLMTAQCDRGAAHAYSWLLQNLGAEEEAARLCESDPRVTRVAEAAAARQAAHLRRCWEVREVMVRWKPGLAETLREFALWRGEEAAGLDGGPQTASAMLGRVVDALYPGLAATHPGSWGAALELLRAGEAEDDFATALTYAVLGLHVSLGLGLHTRRLSMEACLAAAVLYISQKTDQPDRGYHAWCHAARCLEYLAFVPRPLPACVTGTDPCQTSSSAATAGTGAVPGGLVTPHQGAALSSMLAAVRRFLAVDERPGPGSRRWDPHAGLCTAAAACMSRWQRDGRPSTEQCQTVAVLWDSPAAAGAQTGSAPTSRYAASSSHEPSLADLVQEARAMFAVKAHLAATRRCAPGVPGHAPGALQGAGTACTAECVRPPLPPPSAQEQQHPCAPPPAAPVEPPPAAAVEPPADAGRREGLLDVHAPGAAPVLSASAADPGTSVLSAAPAMLLLIALQVARGACWDGVKAPKVAAAGDAAAPRQRADAPRQAVEDEVACLNGMRAALVGPEAAVAFVMLLHLLPSQELSAANDRRLVFQPVLASPECSHAARTAVSVTALCAAVAAGAGAATGDAAGSSQTEHQGTEAPIAEPMHALEFANIRLAEVPSEDGPRAEKRYRWEECRRHQMRVTGGARLDHCVKTLRDVFLSKDLGLTWIQAVGVAGVEQALHLAAQVRRELHAKGRDLCVAVMSLDVVGDEAREAEAVEGRRRRRAEPGTAGDERSARSERSLPVLNPLAVLLGRCQAAQQESSAAPEDKYIAAAAKLLAALRPGGGPPPASTPSLPPLQQTMCVKLLVMECLPGQPGSPAVPQQGGAKRGEEAKGSNEARRAAAARAR